MREGPTMTTHDELPHPIPSCGGCRHLRVVEYHHYACRDLGDPRQPDGPIGIGWRSLPSFAPTVAACRFLNPQR